MDSADRPCCRKTDFVSPPNDNAVRRSPAMKLIDLSREIYHKMPRHPNPPMIILSSFTTREEKRIADGYSFSSAVFSLNMGDHSGAHVDAPVHFDETPGAKSIDEIPLENFFTEAVCLDLSHKPLKSDISIADL